MRVVLCLVHTLTKKRDRRKGIVTDRFRIKLALVTLHRIILPAVALKVLSELYHSRTNLYY
jgi:hypothetical protein